MSIKLRIKGIRRIAAIVVVLAGAAMAVACSRLPEEPLPSLQEKLDARKAAFREKAPKRLQDLFEQGIVDVAKSGVMETALREGDHAPDFTLPNAVGNPVTLSTLLKDGPVVLAWYRGSWCPYCNTQLQALRDALPAFRKRGATLAAISPEKIDLAVPYALRENLDYPVLSDARNAVARRYGIAYRLPEAVAREFKGHIDLQKHNAGDPRELPLAVTYVIDTDGVIRYAFVSPDYRERAEPSRIVEALEALR